MLRCSPYHSAYLFPCSLTFDLNNGNTSKKSTTYSHTLPHSLSLSPSICECVSLSGWLTFAAASKMICCFCMCCATTHVERRNPMVIIMQILHTHTRSHKIMHSTKCVNLCKTQMHWNAAGWIEIPINTYSLSPRKCEGLKLFDFYFSHRTHPYTSTYKTWIECIFLRKIMQCYEIIPQ